ncbi:hypothetical protein BC827DRAFT_1379315 [Russula dissimulans]|nr:hypothetical protein BC827DRAFT_1379315 [Russula dissimulans]
MLQPFTRSLTLSNASDCLLEIVNFNVEGQQYVCAGEVVALQALTNVLNYLKMHEVDVTKVKEMLKDIVNDCYESALEKPKTEGYITLERASGLATIPLSGIDAPFHSCYPWSGVMPFRAYLSKKIHADLLDPSLLNGVYIPDLVASPFTVHKAYAEPIYNRALSPRLSEVLRKWDEERWDAPKQWPKLACPPRRIAIIPVLIETQDLFFEQYKFECFVEIDPSPTHRYGCPHPQSKDQELYQFEDKPEATSELDVPPEAATPSPAPVAAALTVVTPPLVRTAAAGLATTIEDASICAVDILAAIVSQKLKKKLVNSCFLSPSRASPMASRLFRMRSWVTSKAIFSSAPDKGEELPLEALGAALGSGPSDNLGKYTTYTTGLVSHAIDGKMPGGFNISSAKTHLSKAWSLGPQCADAVLLVATTIEPSKRLGSMPLRKSTPNVEEFLKFQAEQYEFTRQQINLHSRYLKRDPRKGKILYDKERASPAGLQARLDSIGREHGDTIGFVKMLSCSTTFGRLSTVDREITTCCIAIMNVPTRSPEVYGLMVNRRVPVKVETVVSQLPLYKDVAFPTAPHTEISEKVEIVYSEVNRENVHKLKAYVEEMCSADQISGSVNILRIQDDVVKLWDVVKSWPEISEEQKNLIKALYDGVVRSLHKVPNNRLRPVFTASTFRHHFHVVMSTDKIPLLHLKRRMGTQWEYDSNLTGVSFGILHKMGTSGTTFKDENALITGIGRAPFAGIFQRFGGRGSALTVVPFNQGSKQDVEALVD